MKSFLRQLLNWKTVVLRIHQSLIQKTGRHSRHFELSQEIHSHRVSRKLPSMISSACIIKEGILRKMPPNCRQNPPQPSADIGVPDLIHLQNKGFSSSPFPIFMKASNWQNRNRNQQAVGPGSVSSRLHRVPIKQETSLTPHLISLLHLQPKEPNQRTQSSTRVKSQTYCLFRPWQHLEELCLCQERSLREENGRA